MKCLNENFELLKDPRVANKTVQRYTGEYGGEYVYRIFPYFDREFVPKLRDREEQPYLFFLLNSHIIGSSNYQKIFFQLNEFLNARKPEEEPEAASEKEDSNSEKAEENKNSSED